MTLTVPDVAPDRYSIHVVQPDASPVKSVNAGPLQSMVQRRRRGSTGATTGAHGATWTSGYAMCELVADAPR